MLNFSENMCKLVFWWWPKAVDSTAGAFSFRNDDIYILIVEVAYMNISHRATKEYLFWATLNSWILSIHHLEFFSSLQESSVEKHNCGIAYIGHKWVSDSSTGHTLALESRDMLFPDKIENWAANDDKKYRRFSSPLHVMPGASNCYVNVFQENFAVTDRFQVYKVLMWLSHSHMHA